jgi:hypothetical protein
MDKDFDGTVDLRKYSIKDVCLWLISKLNAAEYIGQPYTTPYCNYVMSWHQAIPLNAIVMAQSPYPNPIFPEIAAAMSYNTEKCREVMKVDMPPTVAILANDLQIHAGMRKEDTIAVVKDGWMLVVGGILLVNCAVFKPYGTAGAYDECINQINVLSRMLEETEKFGERTVDIIAYGAGQAMASELTKCFKSNIIKLTKYTSSHPASLAYRMNDFNNAECHMGSPSTSKVLAKHFSNHVAYAHTMAKQSAAEIRAQRQLDNIRTLSGQLAPLEEISNSLFPMMKNLLKCIDEEDIENFRLTLEGIIQTGEVFTFRLASASAALTQVQATSGNAGSTVSKPGPSLSTTSPSMASLSQHVGGEFKAAAPIAPRPISLSKSRAVPQSTTAASDSTVNVSSPPSIMSASTATASTTPQGPPMASTGFAAAPRPIKIRKSSAPTIGTSVSEPTKPGPSNSEVLTPKADSPSVDEDDTKTISSIGARFRKLETIQESSQSGNTGKAAERQSPNPEWALSKEIINQLSCIELVVEYYGKEKVDNDDFREAMDALQSDMANKTAYNAMTQRLVAAIKEDMITYPQFDFAKWILDEKKPSATLDQCRIEFEF